MLKGQNQLDLNLEYDLVYLCPTYAKCILIQALIITHLERLGRMSWLEKMLVN